METVTKMKFMDRTIEIKEINGRFEAQCLDVPILYTSGDSAEEVMMEIVGLIKAYNEGE